MFLWKSNLPLYQKLEVPESCSTLHHLIMVASCLQEIDLWYPSFGLQVLIVISVVLKSDCCKSMGWKWDCQPFSCRCWPNVMQCRKEIYAWKSKPPLPTRSLGSLRAAAHFKSSALCLYYARKRFHPFVAAIGKTCLMQRSRRFGHGVVVSKICYNPVIVRALSCAM